MPYKFKKTDEEWKAILSDEAYRVLREKGTERAFTGEYTDNKKIGIYRCAGCQHELFRSEHKFDSGCGWPSFFTPLAEENVELVEDLSHGMYRIEVVCKNCGGHLGHVFKDSPQTPTGLRYCINSVSLTFEEEG